MTQARGMELNLRSSVPVIGWRAGTNLRDFTGKWEGIGSLIGLLWVGMDNDGRKERRQEGREGGERKRERERKVDRFGEQSKWSNN